MVGFFLLSFLFYIYFQAKVVVNGLQELNTPLNYAKSGAVGKVTSHLPISGVVPLKAGDVVTLQVSSVMANSCDLFLQYNLARETISLVWIELSIFKHAALPVNNVAEMMGCPRG